HGSSRPQEARAERRAPAIAPREKPAPAAPAISTGVQTVTVAADEAGVRLDRFFAARFPGLPFSHVQRIVRKGEVRVDGKRADTKDRLDAGQQVRIPPLRFGGEKPERRLSPADEKTRRVLESMPPPAA